MAEMKTTAKETKLPVRAFLDSAKIAKWSDFRKMPLDEQKEILANTRKVRKAEMKTFENLKSGKLPEGALDSYENYLADAFSREGLNMSLCSRLIMHALKNGFNGAYLEYLVDKMVEFSTGSDYQDWSHSVCHRFESPTLNNQFYGRGRDDLIEKLMSASVKGAVATGKLGCTDRTLRGMMLYNLMNIDLKSVDKPLAAPFPDSLQNPEFLRLVGQALTCSVIPANLLVSKTQRGFVLSMLEEYPQFLQKVDKNILENVLEFLGNLVPELGEEKVNFYLQFLTHDSRITPQSALSNLKSPRVKGDLHEKVYYVDVDGTLIVDGRLNVELIRRLEEEKKDGYEVKIISGGNPVEQTERLKTLFAESGTNTILKIQVSSKEELKGKYLPILMDDTLPSIQGLSVGQWFDPNTYFG